MLKWAGIKRNEVRQLYGYILHGYLYDMESVALAKLLALRDLMLWPFVALRRKHCRHEWDVDSCITPDFGYEDFTCKKCGDGDRVRWY